MTDSNKETAPQQPRTHDKQVKLFLAVPLAPSVTSDLGGLAETMRKEAYHGGFEIRWVRPLNYHVTVAFLGNTSPQMIGPIRDRLTNRVAKVPRFKYALRGFGAFPKPERAQVLWAAVHEPSGSLENLARLCSDEMSELGFPTDRRSYHPHVTIGRIKRPDDIRSVLQNNSERTFSKTSVDFMVLFESVMKSGILEYVERARFPLGWADSKPKRHTEALQPESSGTTESSAQSDHNPSSQGASDAHEIVMNQHSDTHSDSAVSDQEPEARA